LRWYHGLTPAQRRILLALALGVVLVLGGLGWSVWTTVQGMTARSALVTPTSGGSVLATATPYPTATPTPTPTVTPTPVFDVAEAGLLAAEVAEARGGLPRWNTPLTLLGEHELAVTLYHRYQAHPPLPLRIRPTLAALRLWFWGEEGVQVDPVTQAQGTAALYASEAEELYLRRVWDGPREILELQLAYGYARALADQYGDLPRLLEDAASLDRKLALMAVGDGDALLTLWGYADAEPGTRRAEVLANMVAQATIPEWQPQDPLLDDLSHLSLNLGNAFVTTLHARGDGDVVRQAVLRPPRSTEQLLHPERYLLADEPEVLLPLTVDLGPDWAPTHAETVGEALMALVLMEWSQGATLTHTLQGWDGDLLQVWQGPEDSDAVLWHTDWDTSGDAVAFYGQMLNVLPRPVLPGLVRDTTPAAGLPQGRWWAGRQGAVFLTRYIDEVWLVWGTDVAAVEAVGAALPASKVTAP
jgi:hypothetical protein